MRPLPCLVLATFFVLPVVNLRSTSCASAAPTPFVVAEDSPDPVAYNAGSFSIFIDPGVTDGVPRDIVAHSVIPWDARAETCLLPASGGRRAFDEPASFDILFASAGVYDFDFEFSFVDLRE